MFTVLFLEILICILLYYIVYKRRLFQITRFAQCSSYWKQYQKKTMLRSFFNTISNVNCIWHIALFEINIFCKGYNIISVFMISITISNIIVTVTIYIVYLHVIYILLCLRIILSYVFNLYIYIRFFNPIIFINNPILFIKITPFYL